ncbi:hypothetical protein D9619_000208 [Psilocybe cf. subviscida]|nr:hypothetical protein D9619_000208 [Psilocybe cf. subviscida]
MASTRPIQKYLQHLTNQTASQATNDTANNPIVDVVRLQSAHLSGYNHALSSSLREGPIRGLTAAFQSPAFAGKRVLLVHGTKDRTVPPKYSTRIMKHLPKDAKAKLITVEGAGHDVNISDSEVVAQAILGLLSTPTKDWNEKS